MKAWTTLFVIGIFATAVVMADDVEDVKAAMQSYFDAINSGNGAAMARHRIPEYSSFLRGGLLDRSSSITQQGDDTQAMTDAGWKRDYRIQHMEVRVYGNAAGGSVNKCVNRHQAAFSWVTGLTGTPLTYWAPW